MTKSSFRKRKRELDRLHIDLLPLDVFPEDAVFMEFQNKRISVILLEFAEPLVSNIEDGNFFQFKTMLYFAVLAWNFSFFEPGKDRHEALDKFLINDEVFNDGNKAKWYNIIDSLSIRRRKNFWQYDFLFVSMDVIKGEKQNTITGKGIPYSLMNIPSVLGNQD